MIQVNTRILLMWVALWFILPYAVGAHTHLKSNPKHVFFVPNNGQWNERILFRAELNAAVLYVEKDALLFVLRDEEKLDKLLSYKYGRGEVPGTNPDDFLIDNYAFRISFRAANPLARHKPQSPADHYLNFFQSKDRSEWVGGVKVYSELTIEDIYPGIDLRLNAENGDLKYTYIILPGADPDNIALDFSPDVRLKKDAIGRLIIPTPFGGVIDSRPTAQIVGSNGKRDVNCSFKTKGNSLKFTIGKGRSLNDTLIIDPVLSFASYSGSTADNWGYTATFDEEGFLYTGGIAFGNGFPVTLGAYQTNFAGGVCDIALSKYDTSGSFLIYSTYLGGSGVEVPSSLVVNNSNELIVLGTTGSDDFPISVGAYDSVFNGGTYYKLSGSLIFGFGSDIVLSRFSADGKNLLSSTYFGGSMNDGLNMFSPLNMNYADDVRGEVVVDEQDNIFIVSSTASTDLQTSVGAMQVNYGGGALDAFVAKLSRDMSVRLWASYMGGADKDAGYSICLSNTNSVYVSGGTTSSNLNTSSGYQSVYAGGSADGFLYHIAADGKSLLAGTYVGSSSYDQTYFIEVDKIGRVYTLGQTNASGSAFIQNVLWSVNGGGQFISQYNPDLSIRNWSTAWGTGKGGLDVSPSAFMVDLCYNIYLSAWGGPLTNNGMGGTSGLPLTPDALFSSTDNNDFYFLVIDKDISQPVFATFYGGTQSAEHVDGGTSRFDRKGTIYQAVCAGCGGFDDFPTTPASWSQVNGSSRCNNAVVKLDFNLPLVVADFDPLVSGCVPYTVTLQNASSGSPGSSIISSWDFGDGNTSSTTNPTHTYLSSGIFPVTLIVTDTAACNYSDTLKRFVVVLSGTSGSLPDVHLCNGELAHIGVPPSPDTSVSFQWSPSTGLSDPNVPNPIVNALNNQLYSLIVSNGVCSDTFAQQVYAHNIQVNLGGDTAVCSDTILLRAAVNQSGLTFHWSSHPDFSNILNTNIYADSLQIVTAGGETFYLKVSDGICEDVDSIRIDFIVITSPIVTIEPSCAGECDGSMVVSVLGGTAPYSYQWNDGQTSDTAQNLCSGNYSVTITDDEGCVSVAQAVLDEPDSISANPLVSTLPCIEACNGHIDPQIEGGTPPYTYLWDNGQNQSIAQNLCAGVHSLTLTDNNGCTFSLSETLEVEWVYDSMSVSPVIDTIYKGQEIVIEAKLIQGVSYQWSPTEGLSDPNAAISTAAPIGTTVYYVFLQDVNGCTYLDSLKIVVMDVICREPYIFIPNSFSPNGDNLNDILFVRSAMVEGMEFLVYDRWGEKVFESTDPAQGWNGSFRGRLCDPGVFVYYLKVRCFDGQVFEKKGNVTLIR